jgi:hypothetical protein
MRRLDNEDKYFLEKRNVLLEAITDIQEDVYGNNNYGGDSNKKEKDKSEEDEEESVQSASAEVDHDNDDVVRASMVKEDANTSSKFTA